MNLELAQASFSLTVVVLATLLIAMIITMILRSREYVKNRIFKQSEKDEARSWVIEQFGQFWHIIAISYFAIIWLCMIYDEFADVQLDNSAFLFSLLLPPLFILFDNVGSWVVQASIKALHIANPQTIDPAHEKYEEKLAQVLKNEKSLRVGATRIIRLLIFGVLLIWMLNIWGIRIPYATELIQAVFESLIIAALGLTAWSFASNYIEKKLAEVEPEEKEKVVDEEFGGVIRDRSYTLLPLIRKFIAITLLVMIILIILSSFGVNIAPLLAGAGVVGLAVGFGSQQLVRDVMSGFFFLLDDAFRVGEYIQGGSMSGSVEAITLRNVMLRHHRGMLQIVPHSNLGSITNFMRGGLVVKFNLEFPSDSNIDQIRKIIKKVGVAMLADEEFGKDFIQPVKSQGVREINGATMVIRVKFTAHPGTQFVIRREAFRRITEALAAKGIRYVTPKVIVEMPRDMEENIEAGAAVASILEKKKESNIREG